MSIDIGDFCRPSAKYLWRKYKRGLKQVGQRRKRRVNKELLHLGQEPESIAPAFYGGFESRDLNGFDNAPWMKRKAWRKLCRQ